MQKKGKKTAVRYLLLFFFMAAGAAETGHAESLNQELTGMQEQTMEGMQEQTMEGKREQSSDEEEQLQRELWKYLETAKTQAQLKEILPGTEYSFEDTVKAFLRGKVPFTAETIRKLSENILWRAVREQKKLAVSMLVIIFCAAVFSNFTKIFRSSQISEISFFMVYLLISVLLMQSFQGMNQIASNAIEALITLMKVILPSYLLTIVFSAGKISATGFSEILLFSFGMLEKMIQSFILPAIQFYFILLILNQISREDYFSKAAQLLETGISWGIKTMMGLVLGFQSVQCLLSPALDQFKNGVFHKTAKAIPVLGNTLDAAAETIAGSAVVLKNAVGAAAMIAVLAVGMIPVTELLAGILIWKILGALIQPVGEKRLVECISSAAEGGILLLKTVLSAMGIFLVSIAMIAAAIRG